MLIAKEMFAAHGYWGTSLTAVARAADLSSTGVTHHFPSKDMLMMAVLDHASSSLLPAVDAGSTGLRASMSELARRACADPSSARLVLMLEAEACSADHPAHRWFQHWRRTLRSSARQWALADPTLRLNQTEAEVLGLQVVATCEGLLLHWLADGDFDVVQAVDAAVATLAAGARVCDTSSV
ncbi:TetR family transcriptional regulator [Kineococcus aurantiacus]|uniref:AcrR family transcriptional regulator n=1 Tax=Kineococcus aurantiacus TaxID=37633 RepID=A0A7Y9J3N4_9ACTN|nr:AcrR family transcriptional regulator [Kineococcus aurantiacus]